TASLADRVSTHAVRATQREVFRRVEVSRCPLAVEAAEQREPSGHLLEPREGEREAIEMSLRLQSQLIDGQGCRHAREIEVTVSPAERPARQASAQEAVTRVPQQLQCARDRALVLKPAEHAVIDERLVIQAAAQSQIHIPRTQERVFQAEPGVAD